MLFEIIFGPEAAENFRRLAAHIRSEVRDAIEGHLRHEPTKVSKSRIKRLRGLRSTAYEWARFASSTMSWKARCMFWH